jgi:hypothetical protein
MVLGLKAFAIDGEPETKRFAVLLAGPAVAVCAVVTPEVVFGFDPEVLLVTSKMTVQLPAAGIVIPLKINPVAPRTRVPGAAPHVPVTLPPAATILASVSLNEALVNAVVALLLLNVKVTVEVPPDTITFGEKAFAMVGAARTVKVSVLLTGPAVVVCAVVTPEVEFGYVPGVLLVTAKVTVQLPAAGIVIPLKVNKPVWFNVSALPDAPEQVPPTAFMPPTADKLAASVSVNEAPVNADVLVLLNVNVTSDMLPD